MTARVGRERKTLTHKSRKGIERLVSDFKAKNPSATFGAIRETLFEGYGWTKISWYFMGPPMEEQVWARGGTRTECEQNIERNIAKKQDEAKLKRLGESEERTIHTNRVAVEMDSWEEERKRQLGGITWATYGQEVIDAKLNSDPGYIGQYNNALGYIKNHMLLPTVTAERGKEVTPFVIGELLLGEMTQQHVQEWLDSVDRRKKPNGEPYSAQTKKLLRSFVRMVYYQAQAAGKPVKTILWDQRRGGIRITKPVHKVKALFSDELVRELFLACEDDQERALVALCLCSLRAPGEVVAVRWRNIRGGIIQVEKQHRDQNGKLIMTNTKTRTVRDVPIPPHLAKFIEAVRPKNAKGDAWVLQGGYRSKSGKKTDLDGSLSPGRAQDIFDKIIVRMKAAMAQKERPVYEEFSIYCCRKTALTALSRVTDPKTLMSIAGHTSVATTMQYYLEASTESKVEAMKKITFGADVVLPC
ncbi:MAG: site-specific integrase [Fimbriimonadaceae bacterium]|nr:site-specific integrase [Fimbriimonadaceae bacterium]